MKAVDSADSAPTDGRVRRKEVWASLALCAIAILAYSNSFHAGFTLDNLVLLQQTRIHEATGGNIGLILRRTYWWPVAETGLYRPLTSLSFLFNYAVLGNGERPEGYHWINFILHAGDIWLAFAVALRLVGRFWPSVFIAGLWAAHPVLTESVTNIVGRADLLAGMSVLGGFLIYLKSTESEGWRRLAWLGCLLVVTTVGVFSKENAVTVIGVIALYELTWWHERGTACRGIRHLVYGMAAILLPLGAFLYQRSMVLAASLPAIFPFTDNPLVGAGFWVGRLTALRVMAHYLVLILWPARLSSDYSYDQIPLITGAPGDWIAWLAVCATGVGLLLMYRRQPAIFFFGLFAFGTFLPTANLVFPIGTIMAERLLYLPSYGLIACFVLIVYRIGERTGMSVFTPAVLLLAMLGFSVRTWERNRDWQNSLTLAESAARVSPWSFRAHMLLARALADADPDARHASLGRAIEEGERAVMLLDRLPDSQSSPTPYRELAVYYLAKGDGLRPATSETESPATPDSMVAWQRAIHLLRHAVSIETFPAPAPPPGYVVVPTHSPEDYRTLSGALLRISDAKGAYDAAVRARDLNPGSADAYRSIANALRAAGRDEEAITALAEGELLTADSSLFADMVLIYRTFPDAGCAVAQGTYGPQLNPACPIVHRQICAAMAGAMQVFLGSQRREQATLMKNRAVENFGCARDPLDKILAAP